VGLFYETEARKVFCEVRGGKVWVGTVGGWDHGWHPVEKDGWTSGGCGAVGRVGRWMVGWSKGWWDVWVRGQQDVRMDEWKHG